MRYLAIALALFLSAPALAEDPDFGKDPNGVPYVSRPMGIPVTQHDIELKENQAQCMEHPMSQSVDPKSQAVVTTNGDWWPDPCSKIMSDWVTSGAKEKYDRIYRSMRSALDAAKATAEHIH